MEIANRWKILASYSWQWINVQNIVITQKTNTKRINNLVSKWTNNLNKRFFKEKWQMANKSKKTCAKSSSLGKFRSQLHCGFFFTWIRMTILKKTDNLFVSMRPWVQTPVLPNKQTNKKENKQKYWPTYTGKKTLKSCWPDCKLV
jgi:hypothetical protein